jgi:5-oxopent-3-ene-1,2,5-tricarboxylate decarboxylase/2-hydroxyhepta-2,4-diene-1,7-dioate isomerase
MTDIHAPTFPIHGTVYGVLLNGHAEWQAAQPLMTEAPYKAPPQAPVLYIKTANTWSLNDSVIAIPPGVDDVEVGMTLGAVMAQDHVRGFVLLNDVSLPHSVAQQGFYRPPVKSKCIDGFLGIGPQVLPAADLPSPNAHALELRINGTVQQRLDLSQLRRHWPQLLSDVTEFMRLQAGDVLMLGLDVCTQGAHAGQRPRVRDGDVVEVHMPGVPGLGVMRHRFVQSMPSLQEAA